jgi:sugar phosphate isomerase/epimerase
MDRRQFINKSAAVLAASVFAGQNLFVSCTTSKNRIGIQLYSIKDELQKNFQGSLKKLADIGYSSVEAYGFTSDDFFGHTMKELSNIVKDMGMSVSGSHIWSSVNVKDPAEKEWDFWKKVSDIINSGGGKWAVQSSLPHAATMDDLKLIASYFNRAGEICKAKGVKFGFHNHTEEFKVIDGVVILDYLIQHTDPELVFFQMDFGHTVNAGADCVRYLSNYPRRITSWHASDFDASIREYTDVGKGSVPYKKLFDLVESSGLEQLVVEQETKGDIFESCKVDFDYLKQYKWTKV